MTAILGWLDRKNGTINIAGDRRITAEGFVKNDTCKKVFMSKNKKAVIGFSGLLKNFQTIKESLINNDDWTENGLIRISEELRAQIKEKGSFEGETDFSIEVIVLCKDGIYTIGEDMSVLRIEKDYYATGNGGNIALGYFACAQKMKREVNKRLVREIFKFTSDNMTSVSPNFDIISIGFKK